MTEPRALRWAVLAVSSLFVALGLLFVCAPELAAALFGLPMALSAEHGYVHAIGARDIALAGYLALLTLCASARAVLIVLLVTLIIPAGDLMLVAAFSRGKASHITRAGFERGLSLVDLRLVCNERADFANPIEPSAQGGEKIAGAIASFVAAEPAYAERPTIWTR